jgi:hypothetical protein
MTNGSLCRQNEFHTKVQEDTCETKAIGDGMNLSGAAKSSLMKKCESEA